MNEQAASTDAIFISIDLEASLGKIDDCVVSDECDAMDCDGDSPITVSPKKRRKARTRPGFYSQSYEDESKERQHIISPYPLSETEDEIKEREKLTETVGYNWSIDKEDNYEVVDDDMQIISEEEGGEVIIPITPSDGWRNSFNIVVKPADISNSNKEDDCDDDFSLSSDEAGSLLAEEEGIGMHKITEDPISFWERGTIISSTSVVEESQSSIASHVSFSSC